MKKFFFSILTLFSVLNLHAQTVYPCTRSFDVLNNGNGGQTCPEIYPSDPAYKKDGTILIAFTGALANGATPPGILTVQKLVNGLLQNAPDMKFVFRQLSADGKTAEYCFYSKNNQNLFNGSGGLFVFTIQYPGLAVQVCDPVTRIGITLPVSFRSFVVSKNRQSVMLRWETSAELDNKGFYVQRKAPSGGWTDLAFVASKAANGSSQSQLSYEYEDVTAGAGEMQYRLKQVDKDGRESFSEIRSVKELAASGFSIFPNPVNSGTVSVVFENAASSYDLLLLDGMGRTVQKQGKVKAGLQFTGLNKGTYLVVVTDIQANKTWSQKLLVQ